MSDEARRGDVRIGRRIEADARAQAAGSLHEDRRLLACLRKPEATNRLSDGCRAKAVAMERLAHRELAFNAVNAHRIVLVEGNLVPVEVLGHVELWRSQAGTNQQQQTSR